MRGESPVVAHPPPTAARRLLQARQSTNGRQRSVAATPHGVAAVLASDVWENISFGICQKT